MKYHIWTIGCQMNLADSRKVAEELELLGCREASPANDADILVLNSCVVRQKAEERVLGYLSSLKPLKKRRPDVILGLMGCLVAEETLPYLKERFPYIDVFCPPAQPEALLESVRRRIEENGGLRFGHHHVETPVSAYVNIIHGCDNFCTYCIVPYRRGRERSRPIWEIVSEMKELVGRGAREVTLLGQNVDSYGQDLPEKPNLAKLLRAVSEVAGLWRIRFLTSHPKDMSQELIKAVAELDKVCEHLEVPVQSGDDEILKRMGRGYTVDKYRDLIQRIRERIPGVGLSTDVIVGFPGETEEQFLRTYDLLREEEFDIVHIASYSARPGTAAARLPDDVPLQEKFRRREAIEELQTNIAGRKNEKLLGQVVEILVEEKAKGKWKGRTRTHKLVFFQDKKDWRGKLAEVKITHASPWSMQGEVIREADVTS